MDRLIYKMPKDIIKHYIDEHPSLITISDFFELEKMGIKVDSKAIENNSILLKSKEILNYAISNNLYQDIIGAMIKNTDFNYADLENYPAFRSSSLILLKVFKNDVRAIRYFDKYSLLPEICVEAVKRGFVATEEDLLFNPELCDSSEIMSVAIKNNPSLVRYITKYCGVQFKEEFYEDVLSRYKITEQDLYNNPALCQIYGIMSRYPEYELYSAFYPFENKVKIVKEIIKAKDYNRLLRLPFFKKEFGSKIGAEQARDLAALLNYNIDEDNIIVQDYFYELYHCLVDCFVQLDYMEKKEKLSFLDGVIKPEDFTKAFEEAKKVHNEHPLIDITRKIYNFINNDEKDRAVIQYDYLYSRVSFLYDAYISDDEDTRHHITVFYNEILNHHRNYFISLEKYKLIKTTKNSFNLSYRKTDTIYNGRKLKIITDLIKNNEYGKLNTTQNELISLVMATIYEINTNKDIIKSSSFISDEVANVLTSVFIKNGVLDSETIKETLKTDNLEVISYIFKKFEQIKLRFVNNIELKEKDLIIDENAKNNIGFNCYNYDIASSDYVVNVITELLFNIDNERANKVLTNSYAIQEVLPIIFFTNIFPRLSLDETINIFAQYDKIRERLIKNNITNRGDIFKNFHEVMLLSKGYSASSDILKTALGIEVYDKIGVKDIKNYFDFYVKMLNRLNGNIPAISINDDNLLFESGIYNDPERLLIGKNCYASCVDLTNFVGKETFISCLTDIKDDVIMVRRKDGTFFARILMFRRGNVIQLGNMYNVEGNRVPLDDVTLLEIAKQIKKQATEVGDNIDYIFATRDLVDKRTSFQKVIDNKFLSDFPHADLNSQVYLIDNFVHSTEKILEDIDLDIESKGIYKKGRKEVSYEPNPVHISRIKALSIALENNAELQNELATSFEPFCSQDYLVTVCGEDWYIAIDKNNQVEEVLLPVSDKRAYEEFARAKGTLLEMIQSIKR